MLVEQSGHKELCNDHFIILIVGMYEPGSTITLQKVEELTKCMKLIPIIKQVSGDAYLMYGGCARRSSTKYGMLIWRVLTIIKG